MEKNIENGMELSFSRGCTMKKCRKKPEESHDVILRSL